MESLDRWLRKAKPLLLFHVSAQLTVLDVTLLKGFRMSDSSTFLVYINGAWKESHCNYYKTCARCAHAAWIVLVQVHINFSHVSSNVACTILMRLHCAIPREAWKRWLISLALTMLYRGKGRGGSHSFVAYEKGSYWRVRPFHFLYIPRPHNDIYLHHEPLTSSLFFRHPFPPLPLPQSS